MTTPNIFCTIAGEGLRRPKHFEKARDGVASLVTEINVTVSRPPSQVWQFLATPANQPKWVTGVATAGPAAPMSAGGRFSVKYSYAKKLHDITFEVVEAAPGSVLQFRTVAGPYPIVATYRLAEAPGGTAVTYVQRAMSDGVFTAVMFTLFGWMLDGQVEKQVLSDHKKMKALVEA